VNVLIAQADADMARRLSRILTERGFTAETCALGAKALAQANARIYDLLIVDPLLPDVDAPSLCRRLREQGSKPPILMVGTGAQLHERVRALDAGADDYVVVPFEVDDLLARIRALLRRASGLGKLGVGALELDRVAREARLAGNPLELTAREYDLLLALVHNADKVITRTELLARVWGTAFEPGSNFLEVHISRLRDKLGRHARMIETVRGVGYRLRTPAGR
jgi:DNA-binding response OmpR family regulator